VPIDGFARILSAHSPHWRDLSAIIKYVAIAPISGVSDVIAIAEEELRRAGWTDGSTVHQEGFAMQTCIGVQRLVRRVAPRKITLAWVGVLIFLVGCPRESTVTRLPGVPSADARQLTTEDKSQNFQNELSPRLLRRFAAIHRPPNTSDSALVRLGRMLYFEPLLSRTGRISCNSCHPLDRYGTTATRFSAGVDGKPGTRNAPTVYNAAGHFRLFWDGRAATLAEQAAGPIGDPAEMGMNPGRAVAVLKAVPGYRTAFSLGFPGEEDPITIGRVTAAIAEFEGGLVTPGRWDRYLDGDTRAITPTEKEGAKLFANLGCMVCHTGAYIGGTMFEKLGVFLPWPNQTDRGRRNITHNPADDMLFKVPSLRNVAQTAPYFHDGSAASLDTAVRLMARHQLGVELTDYEAQIIAAWLGSLTGEIPHKYVAAPVLPRAIRK
jgi:cytochrome c peroxidase